MGRYLRWFLAVVSAACGLIHFAVAGEHFDVSWMHGSFFAVVGWVQLGWAVAVVVRPDERRLLQAGVVLHGGTILVWALSRTVGLPVGHDAGVTEPVAFADAMTSAFEAVVVVAALTHDKLCMKPGFVLGTETATEEECEARGGVLADTSRRWMMHMWNVPQWEKPLGPLRLRAPGPGWPHGDKDAQPDADSDGTWFEEVE